MNSSVTFNDTLFLGIDGGGSKCKAKLQSASGNIVGVGVSGPANVARSIEVSIHSILESAALAAEDAGLTKDCFPDLIVGAGLAGLNLPAGQEAFNNWQHPFKKMYATTDLQIACAAAHGGEDGAVIITGTGSCGLVSVDGKVETLGGHGFVAGDKGSGSWIGAEAIRRSLRAADGLAKKTELFAHICDMLSVQDALGITESLMAATPTQYAKIAPLVFEMAEQGDEVAIDIIKSAANYIDLLARKLLEKNPPRLSMLGGVSQRIKPWLSSDVQASLSEPKNQPESGAIFFARQAYEEGQAQ